MIGNWDGHLLFRTSLGVPAFGETGARDERYPNPHRGNPAVPLDEQLARADSAGPGADARDKGGTMSGGEFRGDLGAGREVHLVGSLAAKGGVGHDGVVLLDVES
jgi:hypothetical protein